MRDFIARKSPELRGHILLVDGKRFGLLVNGSFYSDDAELALAVSKHVNKKQSLQANLAQIRAVYVAHMEAAKPMPAMDIQAPVAAPTQQQERPVTMFALNMVSMLVAVLQTIGSTAVSKAKRTKLLAPVSSMKTINEVGQYLH